MEVGLGILGLAPDHFWSLTLQEFVAAQRGYSEASGARTPGPQRHGTRELKRFLEEMRGAGLA